MVDCFVLVVADDPDLTLTILMSLTLTLTDTTRYYYGVLKIQNYCLPEFAVLREPYGELVLRTVAEGDSVPFRIPFLCP